MAVTDSRSAGVLSVLSSQNIGNPIDDVRKFVSDATGLSMTKVRRKFQRFVGTRPSLDDNWCAVGIPEIETEGTPLINGAKGQISKPESANATLEDHQVISVEVSFFGADAYLIAHNFKASCGIPQTVRWLNHYGMTIRSVDSEISRQPDFVFEQYCDKYVVKMKLARKSSRVFGIRDYATIGDVNLLTDNHTTE